MSETRADAFFSLTPERMLDALELALDSKSTGIRATGSIQSLNSVENRVVEFEMDDEVRWVAKFYRPGRWSREALLEEHQFLARLAAAEVPVVPPTKFGQTDDGIFFAIFPKVRGRLKDELNDAEVRQIGRYLARIHLVSEGVKTSHRPALTVQSHLDEPLAFLMDGDFLQEPARSRYESIVGRLREVVAPRLAEAEKRNKPILLHGDCHIGNVLWASQKGKEESTAFFVDFDDARLGIPIQDLWMVVPGDPTKDDEVRHQQEELVGAYRVFRPLDDAAWSIVEPLRAMRMVYYAAWIGRRWEDPAFPGLFPDFGTTRYWQEEIDALSQCFARIVGLDQSDT